MDDLDHEEQDEVEHVEVEQVEVEQDEVEQAEVEQDEVEQVEVEAGAGAAQEDVPPYCVQWKGNICYCEDESQVTYITLTLSTTSSWRKPPMCTPRIWTRTRNIGAVTTR